MCYPVWGSSRAAVDDFQNGNWGWGLFHTAIAVSDVFLVKSLVTGVGKLAAAGIGRLAAEESTTMLGHTVDNYAETAIQNGYNYFKVTEYCQPANQLFLDEAILRGDKIIMSRSIGDIIQGSKFEWEVGYMLKNDYQVLNSTTLIPK